MQPTSEDTRRALLKLLSVTAGTALGSLDGELPVGQQIDLCVERTKVEAEGAALVDACAPHGRAMLTQAQKRLENLQCYCKRLIELIMLFVDPPRLV